jgi:hypothetical protein
MEKVSLFNELKSGGYESSLITTFNAYFPFYEEVLLRKLRSCGVQKNAVLIDETMCKQAMEVAYPVLSGKAYTLAPMSCSKAFHPKIVLLIGKKKGLLAIGSHNLTFSGFGASAELTNVVRFNSNSSDSVQLFWDAWFAIQTWIRDYGSQLPSSTIRAINSTIEGIPWFTKPSLLNQSEVQFLFSSKSRASLWSQVSPLVPNYVNDCFVIGAFFDAQLSFISTIRNEVKPENMVVGIQPGTVHASSKLLTLEGISVVDSSSLITEGDREKYIHAKAIYFKGKDSSSLVVGSANPSSPAWVNTGCECNAEAVLVRTDDEVDNIADYLGLTALSTSRKVTEISQPVSALFEPSKDQTFKLCVATLQDKNLVIHIPIALSNARVHLENASGVILEKLHLESGTEIQSIKVSDKYRRELARASIWEKDELLARVMIFFTDEIEANTATGNKKKFRDALGSLDTDSPELKVLFNCLDKIIFESHDESRTSRISNSGSSRHDEVVEGHSLIVDWEGVANNIRTKKKRLKVPDDLTALLDIIVYKIGTHPAETMGFSAEDKFGRNEEELIGSDDEDNADTDETELSNSGALSDDEKLTICHRRLNAIVNKICVRLESLNKNQITHLELLPALLAVTSLLKELNQRSRNFNWIKENDKILPTEAIKKLFETLCNCWWGSSYGLQQNFEGEVELIDEVDELIRLRGLLIWLAWSRDITFETSNRFGEEQKTRNSRLWKNSVYILLAQLVVNDDLLEEEASRICASEGEGCLKWYAEFVKFGRTLNRRYICAISNKSTLARPTDDTWVLHENGAFTGLRYCYAVDGSFARMPSVAEKGDFKQFSVDKLLAC